MATSDSRLASDVLRVLLVAGSQPAWAGPQVQVTLATGVTQARQHDAVVFLAADDRAAQALAESDAFLQSTFDTAVLVIAARAGDATAAALLRKGAQDVLAKADPTTVTRALRHAVERKRLELQARMAYATDLATGLPHQAQLLEHMSQMLALRERDPAPMVLIVLRVEGLASTAARMGVEAGNILRRKVAVRLRNVLRASDVVASTAPDSFGILLGHIESPGDGEHVVSKLVQVLQRPFQIAGQSCAVATATGLALYPEHGKDALALLQRAAVQAASAAAQGREGFATHVERGAAKAANDDG